MLRSEAHSFSYHHHPLAQWLLHHLGWDEPFRNQRCDVACLRSAPHSAEQSAASYIGIATQEWSCCCSCKWEWSDSWRRIVQSSDEAQTVLHWSYCPPHPKSPALVVLRPKQRAASRSQRSWSAPEQPEDNVPTQKTRHGHTQTKVLNFKMF